MVISLNFDEIFLLKNYKLTRTYSTINRIPIKGIINLKEYTYQKNKGKS